MNDLNRCAATVVVVALMLSGTANSQDANVLLKDSFEKGQKAPDNWKSGANIPGVKYIYDNHRGKTGKRSLSLQKSAQRYFPIAQWTRILPNPGKHPALKVTTQVRAQGATKAIVDVIFLDASGKSMGHKWASYIGAKKAGGQPANHDWKEYSGVVSIPRGTKQIMFALQIYGPGKVWFDDITATFVNAVGAEPETKAVENAIELKVGEGVGRYLLVSAKAKQVSKKGHGLLVVLPGGDGSAVFHPFVKRIHDNSLGEDFVLAQPIAKKWTDNQIIVWPTATSKSDAMKYTTEELVASVIDHVSQKIKIDPKRVYLLAWSSGGPAAYATLLQKNTPVTGGLIAMSVFKPHQLPDAANAKGRSIYLLHSSQDKVCPYWMAEAGHEALSKAGVRTKLVNYEGGHGWKGDVYGNIRRGIEWLQRSE